jgi:uroporphyrin-III C-methyltransferase
VSPPRQGPLGGGGRGRSVCLATAATQSGDLQAGQRADTEVFYMAGKQLAALSRRLLAAGWPATTPVLVVSRAGWPDQRASEARVDSLPAAALLHAGRPTVVTVGVGATPSPAGPITPCLEQHQAKVQSLAS